MNPRDRVGTNCIQDLGVHYKSRIGHIGQYGSHRIGHTPQSFQTTATILVEFRLCSVLAPQSQPLRRASIRNLLSGAVDPTKAKGFFYDV